MATETEIDRLVIRLLGDSSSLASMFNQAHGMLSSFANTVKNYGAMIAVTLGAGTLSAMGAQAIQLAANLEQTTISFETMLGSAGRARSMLKEIQVYAAATPFEQAPLRQSAQMLMNYGIAAEQIMPTLKMLGDVSAGDQNKLNGLSYAFAQMSARGKVAGDDLRQMINWGFNPLQEMARTSGKSMAELTEQMHEGKITIDMLRGAFASATQQGGRFFGMMEKQAKTLIGLWSTAKDEISFALTELGQVMIDKLNIKEILTQSINYLQVATQLIKQYGAYVVVAAEGLAAFLTSWAALKIAIFAGKMALDLYNAALRSTMILEAMLKGIQGPAGWAQLALGLTAAGVVAAKVASEFQKIAEEGNKAADAAKNIDNAVKGMDNRKPEQVLNDLQKQMRLINQSKDILGPQRTEAIAKKTLDNSGALRALGLTPVVTELTDAQKKIINIRSALGVLDTEWKKVMNPADAQTLRVKLQTALQAAGNEASGSTEMLKKLREEIISVREELDPLLVSQRMQAAGASANFLDEIDKLNKVKAGLEAQLTLKKTIADIRSQPNPMRLEGDALMESVKDARSKFTDEMNKYDTLFKNGFITQGTLDKLTRDAKYNLRAPIDSMLNEIRTPREKLARELEEIDRMYDKGLLSNEERDKLKQKKARDSVFGPAAGPIDSAVVGSKEAASHLMEFTMGASINPQLVAMTKTNDKLDRIEAVLERIEKTNTTMAGEPPITIREVSGLA